MDSTWQCQTCLKFHNNITFTWGFNQGPLCCVEMATHIKELKQNGASKPRAMSNYRWSLKVISSHIWSPIIHIDCLFNYIWLMYDSTSYAAFSGVLLFFSGDITKFKVSSFVYSCGIVYENLCWVLTLILVMPNILLFLRLYNLTVCVIECWMAYVHPRDV